MAPTCCHGTLKVKRASVFSIKSLTGKNTLSGNSYLAAATSNTLCITNVNEIKFMPVISEGALYLFCNHQLTIAHEK